MRRTVANTTAGMLLLVLLHTSAGTGQSVITDENAQKDEMALLPFQIVGFSADEGMQMTERFGAALGESGRFRIVTGEELRRALVDAGWIRIDSCTTVPCLARLGFLIHVGRVVRVSAWRWGQRCALHMQVVAASDGRLLYDERTDFTGPFEELLASVTPEQGRRLSQAFLDKRPNWYLIALVVLLGVSVIIWLYRFLRFPTNLPSEGRPSTPTPQ